MSRRGEIATRRIGAPRGGTGKNAWGKPQALGIGPTTPGVIDGSGNRVIDGSGNRVVL